MSNATCETHGHIYGAHGRCIFCDDQPGTSQPLLELRAIAVSALEHPLNERVPRHERDLVVQAEVLIKLIDHYTQLISAEQFMLELRELGEQLAADGKKVIKSLLHEAEANGRKHCLFENWPAHLQADAYERLGVTPQLMYRRDSEPKP
jgi:hypothetical protein